MSNLNEIENPLGPLRVIDRIDIGPVRLEKRRILAPYKVTRKGVSHTTTLIYRFEENVFDPDDRHSVNLANMIGAQVGINYGLFCDEIFFHGLYDIHDRKFLTETARNTAREIYVKKILEHNPYINDLKGNIPPIKMKDYLRAALVFPEESDSLYDQDSAKRRNRNGYAVLSSGGKDSLLSFGLLSEICKDVHPIFINESGRHWFTALNAYRYFSKAVPNTSRVWTNSDRVFSWMLNHIQFIRKDHKRIRSDEYPIRLWTVAVFLFGALPILRKRGIGRIAIGDEYDTTYKLTFKGITHYDGLYDQSQYFDNAMSRYFHQKGWGISQFSILRPLSELLIEKLLLEHYPELHKHQVSCHAAHKEGEYARPCGKCEKCRRIISMIMALGADPGNCGYSAKQIEQCIRDLPSKGINQEKQGVEHLAFLLKQRNLIPEPSIGSVAGRERPQIMSLRFDPERSPLEGIPMELREPLYKIYTRFTAKSFKRSGRTWLEFDLWSDQALRRPFPFDSPIPNAAEVIRDGRREKGYKKNYLLNQMTWPEAKTRFEEVDIALLPVGAIEQHGPHLPLDCDAFDAEYAAHRVAEECSDPKPIVFPLVPYGVSYHHEDFCGTISINPESLSNLVYDIGMSAVGHGITKLVIINGHGGNSPALHFAAQMINRDAHIFTCVDTGETSDPDIDAMAETPNDVHAGEIETSTTLATRPNLVNMKEARKFIPRFSSPYLNFTSKRSVGWYAHTLKISPTGILGDPTKGTKEKGERIWEVMIKNLVEFVEELKKLSLDEIYQKRY